MSLKKLLTATLLLLTAIALTNTPPVCAQPAADATLLLWSEGAPGAKGVSDLDQPELTVFLPEEGKAAGTGVVVFPGGGYSHLAMEKEGYKVARWLNSLGVAAFVVKYRLGERYHYPAQLLDAQRAIRLVRSRAEKWKVDAGRIGILGFSAGGHLASTAGTHFKNENSGTSDPVGKLSARPDFMILIYPVITMQNDYTHRGSRHHLLGENPGPELVELLSNETQVTAQIPPAFIIHGSNDTVVPVQNSVQFYLALVEHGVPAEMHLYEDGPHGFGLALDDPELSSWTELCAAWLKGRGLLSN